MTSSRWRVRGAGKVARTLAVATAVLVAAVATGTSEQASGVAPAFRITGSISGLYPGGPLSLRLTVTNDENFRIEVSSITTTVHDAAPSCPAADLAVGRYAGPLVVPANGTRSTHVPARLSHAAGNACQGAVFPLSYSGHAIKG